MSAPVAVASLDDLTPVWLTEVLRGHGALNSGGEVAEVRSDRLNVGFASLNARLNLRYSGDEGEAPSSLIVKLASEHEGARTVAAVAGLYAREVAFYSGIAGRRGASAGMQVPECYFADLDPETQQVTILIEDFSPATVRSHELGFAFDECVRAVEAVSSMHARWWASKELDAHSILRTPPSEAFIRGRGLFDGSLPVAKDKLRDLLEPRSWELLDRLDYGVAMERSYGAPRTLVHGDYHGANIFLETPHGPPAAVDWQTIQAGLGINDIAKLAIDGLQEVDRTDDLVAAYVRSLSSRGVEYPAAAAQRDFTDMTLYHAGRIIVFMATMDVDSDEGRRIAASMASRMNSALGRLRPSDLVGPIVAT